MAQLDDQAAADDQTVDNAAAPENDAADDSQEQSDERDTLGDMYPDEGETPADDASGSGQGDDGGEAEGGEEEGDEGGGDGGADGEPPIAPPATWKAQEKDTFAKLPRDVQQVISRREQERERFVQAKAQEAVQVRTQLQQEALTHVQQLSQQHIAHIQALLPEIPEEPPYSLQLDDPEQYAQIMDYRRAVIAQHQQVQQMTQTEQQRVQAAQQTLAAIEAQRTHAVLSEKFPEYLDPEDGPKLREELGSIAVELGYPAEQLVNVDATDILAMKKVRGLKVKADKWDALQSRRMSDVRQGKKLTPTARPGAATGRARAPSSDPLKLLYPND